MKYDTTRSIGIEGWLAVKYGKAGRQDKKCTILAYIGFAVCHTMESTESLARRLRILKLQEVDRYSHYGGM